MVDDAKTFMVEDARLVFRNFSGVEGQYNRKGDRNFAVILDESVVETMIKDGWNVKYLDSREDGVADTPYISVAVNFNNRPPRITLITSTSRTNLTEDSVAVLDWAEIQTCDLIARAYDWTVGEKSGVKAYLQTMFITIEEDALERKYAMPNEGE